MANPDRTGLRRGRRGWGWLFVPLLLLVVLLAPLPGGATPPAQLAMLPTADSVWVTAGGHYRGGALHQFLLGSHYREVWTTPIRVRVLRLDRFEGGLLPIREGGGRQTRTLHWRSNAGRQFVFRSTDKALRLLPKPFTKSLLGRILQDGTSAAHPGAPFVAVSLQHALGIPGPDPELVVLPDDPRLGAFRFRYRGLLGTLQQEAPDSGPGGAGSTEQVLAILDTCRNQRVDATGFLAARLLDFLLNDWDRHGNQWNWFSARNDSATVWRPIPEDRDQALGWYDGLVVDLLRPVMPKLVKFGPEFPSLRGLTWNSRNLDRRFLAELSRSEWDSVTRFVQSRLDDRALRRAVERMPEGWRRLSGDLIFETLRQRRDRLIGISRAFYERVH